MGKYINGDVREIITSFSGITGYMDKSSQINFIELICDKLNQKERNVTKVSLGNAELTFMRQRELVDFAVEWIEKNRS